MEAHGILTMVLGAVIIVAGVHHVDPAGTLGGAFIYMAGVYWPPRAPRTQNTRGSEERPGV